MENERNASLDAYIDDLYETVSICGLAFSPSDIVWELDPIAYNCMANDLGFNDDDEEEEDDEDDEIED